MSSPPKSPSVTTPAKNHKLVSCTSQTYVLVHLSDGSTILLFSQRQNIGIKWTMFPCKAFQRCYYVHVCWLYLKNVNNKVKRTDVEILFCRRWKEKKSTKLKIPEKPLFGELIPTRLQLGEKSHLLIKRF